MSGGDAFHYSIQGEISYFFFLFPPDLSYWEFVGVLSSWEWNTCQVWNRSTGKNNLKASADIQDYF